MRILVVPRDFPSDGQPYAGMFVLRQALALRDLGHELQVLRLVPAAPGLSPKWSAYRRIPATYDVEGVQVRTIRALVPPRLLGIGMVRTQFEPALRRAVARFAPDLIHAHCTLPTAALCAGIRGVPIIVTAHGSDTYVEPWQRGDLERAARGALQRAAAVVAVSSFVAGSVRRLGRDDAVIVFNGADERIFGPKSRSLSRKDLNIPEQRRVIAFAGSFLRSKGIFELADAVAQLRDLQPLLVLVGDGPEAPAVRARLQELAVDHRLMGLSSQDALAAVLDAADVFVLPSHAEGLPTVVCEAMLAGRAVVATRVGGTPEIVRDGETGLLVGVNDVDGLAAALRRVLTDGAFRSHLASGAREFALAQLTWTRNALAYDGIYRQVADRQPAAHRSA